MEDERTEQTTAGESQGLPETAPAAEQAENTQTDSAQTSGKKPSWEEILADPEYKSRYDAAV